MTENKPFRARTIFIILIPIFLGLFLTLTAYQNTRDSIYLDLESGQKRRRDYLSEQDLYLKNITGHIIMNPVIDDILAAADPGDLLSINRYNSSPSANRLLPLSLTDPLIKDYFILSFDNHLVVNPRFSASTETFFSHLYIANSGLLGEEEILETLKSRIFTNSYYPEIHLEDKHNPLTDEYTLFLHSIIREGKPEGVVMILISLEELSSNLHRADSVPGKEIMLIDGEGIPFFSEDISERLQLYRQRLVLQEADTILNFRKYYAIYSEVAPTSLKILTFVRKTQILQQISYIMKSTAVLTILVIMISSLISGYLAYISSQPLLKITRELEKSEIEEWGQTGPLARTKRFLAEITGKNVVYKEKMDQTHDFLANMFLSNIIRGDLKTAELQKGDLMNSLGLNKGPFQVILIHVGRKNALGTNEDRQEEIILTKLGIIDFIKKNKSPHVHPVNLDGQMMALIYSPEEVPPSDSAEEIIKTLMLPIRDMTDEHLEIAAGSFKESVREIYQSYFEANIALNHTPEDRGSTIVFFSEHHRQSSQFIYYPPEMEQRIKLLAEKGSEKELRDSLDELFTLNLSEINTDQVNKRLLFSLLKGTILRIIHENSLDDKAILKQVRKVLTISHEDEAVKISAFKECLLLISRKISRSRDYQREALKGRIEAYLFEHIQDPALSISLVSKNFNYSDQYFSGLFKEIFSVNFHKWIEQKRFDRIIGDFKKYPDMTIKEIMHQNGYISLNTFSKAFKRHFGINASEYRNLLSKKL